MLYFSLFAAYLLTSGGLFALLLQLGGFLSPRISTRAGREALLLAGIVLAVLILRLAGVKVNWSMPLLSWSWPMTVLLLMLAVFLFALHCWRPSHSEHTFSVRRVPMFVASVAVFDWTLLDPKLIKGDQPTADRRSAPTYLWRKPLLISRRTKSLNTWHDKITGHQQHLHFGLRR